MSPIVAPEDDIFDLDLVLVPGEAAPAGPVAATTYTVSELGCAPTGGVYTCQGTLDCGGCSATYGLVAMCV